jgi:hypothetical protein
VFTGVGTGDAETGDRRRDGSRETEGLEFRSEFRSIQASAQPRQDRDRSIGIRIDRADHTRRQDRTSRRVHGQFRPR